MQMTSTRSSDLTRTGMSAMYCAEAGLAAARSVVTANFNQIAGNLYVGTTPGYSVAYSGSLEPTWLYNGIGAAGHDIDNDTHDDFMVYLKDNDDEIGTNDPSTDTDLRIFIVSRCLKYGETVKEVEELVQFNGGGHCYQAQLGGCGGNGNTN
jgi:hypothetical protein